LFITRGVPGTHDIDLAKSILSSLKLKDIDGLTIPLFDKAIDDRVDKKQWKTLSQPVDIILFEGWCVGASAQDTEELLQPVNSLEQEEDAKALWRSYVNEQLAGPYVEVFSFIDILIMMKVPDMKNVFDWRLLQEKKLEITSAKQLKSNLKVMSEEELNRFIMHYERITRFSLEEMPSRADVVMELNDSHQIHCVNMKNYK